MDNQVSLEAYGEENRTLIHNGRNDEAIAVCKHVLQYYPKHVETYRQLGEAYLEKGDLDNAKEMFRRVLSADPENVIAYVGLSSIFEQQQLIDETVWHLERAYEIAPNNLEIHKELLRLYSTVGKPLKRLKITPAGLARLYASEGLYSQAIQELNAIVAESPSRYDARIALAETLWRAGRMREAANAAEALLGTLPYCLKANLILGTALKESGLPECTTHLSRAQELDPTNKVAQKLLGPRSPLPPVQIGVMRYVEGSSTGTRPAQAPAESTTEVSEEAATAPAEETMTGRETTILTAPQEQTPVAPSETEPAKPDLVSNLPPWLLSQFPETPPSAPPVEPAQPPPTATEPAGSEKLPEWLDSHGESTAPAPTIEQKTEQVEKPTEEEIPDWIHNLQSQLPPVEEAPAGGTPQVESDGLPVWLESPGEQPPAGPPSKGETKAAKASGAGQSPAWLRDVKTPGPTEEVPAAKPQSERPPEWLRNLPAPAAAEQVPAAESQSEQSPEWLRNLPTPAAAEQVPAAESQTAAAAAEEVVTSLPGFPQAALPAAEPEQAAELPAAAPLAASEPLKPAETRPSPTPSAPAFAPAAPPAEPAPKRRRQPKGYAHLMLAREHRDAHQVNESLAEYDYIVQHAPRLVKEVIDDLEMLTAQSDAPLDAHRILGDAYSRADRLAEALECYQFVLERTSKEASA